jgi:hypothetical protein
LTTRILSITLVVHDLIVNNMKRDLSIALASLLIVGFASEARSTLSLLPEPSFWLPGDASAAKGEMEQATDFLRNAFSR